MIQTIHGRQVTAKDLVGIYKYAVTRADAREIVAGATPDRPRRGPVALTQDNAKAVRDANTVFTRLYDGHPMRQRIQTALAERSHARLRKLAPLLRAWLEGRMEDVSRML